MVIRKTMKITRGSPENRRVSQLSGEDQLILAVWKMHRFLFDLKQDDCPTVMLPKSESIDGRAVLQKKGQRFSTCGSLLSTISVKDEIHVVLESPQSILRGFFAGFLQFCLFGFV
jgi:hypothetical protein